MRDGLRVVVRSQPGSSHGIRRCVGHLLQRHSLRKALVPHERDALLSIVLLWVAHAAAVRHAHAGSRRHSVRACSDHHLLLLLLLPHLLRLQAHQQGDLPLQRQNLRLQHLHSMISGVRF